MTRAWWSIVLVVVACSRDPKPKTDDVRMNTASLGALTFPVTQGSPAARAHFTRGLLALHSFWYDEAKREFEAAIAADKAMNMAYWGLAMSHCKLLWGEDDVEAAKKALTAMPDPESLSQREQAWVMATVELLKADDARTSRKQYAQAMAALHATFPDDETATFLAIAMLSASRPEDLNHLAIRDRVAELAAGVYARNPKHPGAAHYLIHAYDTPELAAIAPEAFHARHMPSHIFSRLGMWEDAIASCQSAWDASLAAAKHAKLSADHHDFHSLTWLVEMPFERGQRSKADAALRTFAVAVRAGLNHQNRAAYATSVASYMMRTGEWARVDELLAPLDAKPVADSMPPAVRGSGTASHCAPSSSPPALLEKLSVLDARARAAAARRDVPATERFLGELDGVRTQLRPFLQATQSPEAVARIETSSARTRRAMIARASGDDRALLEVLRESVGEAEVEAGGENNPSGFNVREEIADVLVRTGQPAEAAAEYERALQRHPKRARSLLGAARARAQAGDTEAAARWYGELRAVWSAAEPATDGLAEVSGKL